VQRGTAEATIEKGGSTSKDVLTVDGCAAAWEQLELN